MKSEVELLRMRRRSLVRLLNCLSRIGVIGRDVVMTHNQLEDFCVRTKRL